MWQSESDVLVYLVTLASWLARYNRSIPTIKLPDISKYWQQKCTVEVHLDENWSLDLYSPRQVPTVDVYIDGVYDYHLSSEIKELLNTTHLQIHPPG